MIARLQKSLKDKDRGFTLIELLVVIVIIGILAAIAIPIFLNQRKKGVDASLQSDVKNAATSVETWMVDNPSTAVPTETVVGPAKGAAAGPAAHPRRGIGGARRGPRTGATTRTHDPAQGVHHLSRRPRHADRLADRSDPAPVPP